ncbi:MAG: ArsA-related P-loop ATPase [Actinomycetota bacterium]
MLDHALDGCRVVLCAGPGGVGKTTISAAIALGLARSGSRVCVLTVDPARRLADALAMTADGNEAVSIPIEGGGSLTAVMLDATGTFDDLIGRYAENEAQAATIRENRIFRSLSGALSGTQEYMAMEKLYELSASGLFDVVVVDTPPTRNALDLLDAPRRLEQFLTNRVTRTLLAPTRRGLRAVNAAASGILKQVGRVAGAQVVADAIVFFQAFSGMEQGFLERAGDVRSLLHEASTAYVLVTAPLPAAITESKYFIDRLEGDGLVLAAVIANRCTPSPGSGEELPREQFGASALGDLLDNFWEIRAEAELHRAAVEELVAARAESKVLVVPLRPAGVASLEELRDLAEDLA